MKQIAVFLLLFSLYPKFTFAQGTTSKATYRITTPFFQDIAKYYTLTFEKVFIKKTLGISLGVKPSTQKSGEIHFKTGPGLFTYQKNNFNNKLYSSFTIDLFAKFYFGKKQKSFLMPDIYYRLWWFTEKDCSFKSSDVSSNEYYYSYDGIRTEQQQQIGLKLLYGRTYKLNKDGKIRPILEPNAGVGLFVRSYKFQTYQGTVNDVYYDYHKEADIGLFPSLHLNLNIGVEFDVKKK